MAMPETGPLTEATVLPVAAERAVWAIAELAAGCPDNQELVRQLHGIAPLVWLLDGPADSMITIGERCWDIFECLPLQIHPMKDSGFAVALLYLSAPLVWLIYGPADSMITIGEQPGMLLDLYKSSCEMHRAL